MLFATQQPSHERLEKRTRRRHYHCTSETRMKKKFFDDNHDALLEQHVHSGLSPNQLALTIKHEKRRVDFKKIYPIIN